MAADSSDKESAQSASNGPEVSLPQRMAGGLKHLHQSLQLAADSGLDVWQFAVEMNTVLDDGLTRTDCRWLVCNGFIDQAREISVPGASRREFQKSENLKFWNSTCFVLSDLGLEELSRFASAAERPNADVLMSSQLPSWSADRHELRFRGVVVKRFKLPAPNQEVILQAFEEERWPVRIDDPLKPKAGQDSKRRLHDTINSLNRRQKRPLLRFYGDGTGRGVCWETQHASPGGE